ncbi:MAG TPA: hypothetical protein VGD77_13415 [Gemmatimonadaceae bacterium]
MREQHLIAILTLDWRRLRRGFGTLALFAGAVFTFLAATGRLNPENVIPIALGGALSVLFAVALLGLRDRLEGTLSLLASLPVPAGSLAASRLLSLVILTFPVALVVAVVAGLAAGGAHLALQQFGVLTVVIWTGLASGVVWLAAISIAIAPQKASSTFAAMMFAAYFILSPVERMFPDARSLIEALMNPTNAWVWPIVLGAMLTASALGAWALTTWGIRNYVMEAERPG